MFYSNQAIVWVLFDCVDWQVLWVWHSSGGSSKGTYGIQSRGNECIPRHRLGQIDGPTIRIHCHAGEHLLILLSSALTNHHFQTPADAWVLARSKSIVSCLGLKRHTNMRPSVQYHKFNCKTSKNISAIWWRVVLEMVYIPELGPFK